jgi:hypothetical protein
MRSFDLFSEKVLKDNSSDIASSKKLSQEAGKLEEGNPGGMKDLTSADKSALASVSLWVGIPFLTCLLGTTISMFENKAFGKKDKDKEIDPRQAGMALVAADSLAKKKKLSNRESLGLRENIIDLKPMVDWSSVEDVRKKARKNRKGKFSTLENTARDNTITLGDDTKSGDNTLAGGKVQGKFMDRRRTQMEVDKLLKRRQFLKDQMERLCQREEYAAVCKLASEIEKLDKSLSRLGFAV